MLDPQLDLIGLQKQLSKVNHFGRWIYFTKIRITSYNVCYTKLLRSCDAERKHGEAATRFVESLILGQNVKIVTYKAGAGIYGRFTADIIIEDGRNLIV